MKCWFDGLLDLRKGDRVQILRAVHEAYEEYALRVNDFEAVTTGAHHSSTFDSNQLKERIVGKVINSHVSRGKSATFFEIVEGQFEDHVFVPTGQFEKGQEVLRDILGSIRDEYIKIWDPYISVDTIKLVSNIGDSKTILILTDKVKDIDKVRQEAQASPNRVLIKRRADKDHDRWILTKGEGWHVGQSLKDFGRKTSSITKLTTSVQEEDEFDEIWNDPETKTVFEKN
jgi:hypothetical protein